MLFRSVGLPGGSDSEEPTCNAGDLSSVPGLGRSPGEGKVYLLQYSGLENPDGQRSLAGYSPWDCKESDINEHIHIPHYLLSQLCQIKLLDGKKERSGEWF